MAGLAQEIYPTNSLGLKKVYSLGGCSVYSLLETVAKYFDWRHYWRSTIPMLVAPPISLTFDTVYVPQAKRLLEREARRLALHRILNGDPSVLIFSAFSDLFVGYYDIGGVLLPDIADAIIDPNWASINLRDSLPSSAKKISPWDPSYWNIWMEAFLRFREMVVKPMRSKGNSVIMLRSYLCENVADAGSIFQSPDLEIVRSGNIFLREIYEFVDKFPEIHIVDTWGPDAYTSDHAPHGRFYGHPSLEFYIDSAIRLLNAIYPATDVSEEFILFALKQYSCSRSTNFDLDILKLQP